MILSYFRGRTGVCNRKHTTARLGQQAVSFLWFLSQEWVCCLFFRGVSFSEGHFHVRKRPLSGRCQPDEMREREKSMWHTWLCKLYRGTDLTKLSHMDFPRFSGRKQCFLSAFLHSCRVHPVLPIQRRDRAERYSFQLCIAAVSFSDCRPLFCLLSPRSFAFLSCKGKCWRHWLKFRLAFHKKSPPFGSYSSCSRFLKNLLLLLTTPFDAA